MAKKKVAKKSSLASVGARLGKFALGCPEANEEHPWGERAFKVRGKTFLFLHQERGHLSLSLKLPQTGQQALKLPFAKPTGYGLGKSGWVTASFDESNDGAAAQVPVEMFEEWITESYLAIAPKRLTQQLREAEPE